MTIRFATTLILLVAASASSQPIPSHSPDPKVPGRGRGFVEFALRQINPQDKDYGCKLDAGRTLLVEHGLEDFNFWGFLLALTLLCTACFLLVHQHRERSRREIVAARFLTEYHNAYQLALARTQDATELCNELFKQLYQSGKKNIFLGPEKEAGYRTGTPSEQEHLQAARPNQQVPYDLMAQISILREQLTDCGEKERSLKEEIAKTRRAASAKGKKVAEHEQRHE